MRKLALILFTLLSIASCGKKDEKPPDPVVSKSHYIDKTGKIAVEPEVPVVNAYDFQEGLALVENNIKKFGYINKQGKLVIPFDYVGGTYHSGGVAGVAQERLCGYVGLKGELLVPLIYDSVRTFQFGWGSVSRGGKFTFVNTKGEEINQWFSGVEDFSENLAAVAPLPAAGAGNTAPLYGYIDTTGKMVISPAYADAEPFSEGLAAVQLDGKWGYIAKTGSMIIEPQFGVAGPFHEGLAQVTVESKIGYIDPEGNIVIEPQFEPDESRFDADEKQILIGQFVDGLAAVRHKTGAEAVAGWGFIDKTGKFVIPPIYEDAFMFSEGLASVYKDGLWGFVDSSGKTVIPLKYKSAQPFKEGVSAVHEK